MPKNNRTSSRADRDSEIVGFFVLIDPKRLNMTFLFQKSNFLLAFCKKRLYVTGDYGGRYITSEPKE